MPAHSTYRRGSETEPDFRRIAQKIGAGLRQSYAHPETVQLPTDQVELLLRLRHKERDRARGG